MNEILDRLRRAILRPLRALIRRVRSLFRAEPIPAPAPHVEGAIFDGSVQSGLQRRTYRLYVPESVGDTPAPLVVMLHGCRQTPDSFATGTRMNAVADDFSALVLYPAQSRLVNPLGCWNWFLRANQGAGGEPALVFDMVDEIAAHWPVDPERIFVAGLSAGGAMAHTLGRVYPRRFAGVGVHSALPGDAARDIKSAYAAMGEGTVAPVSLPGVPVILFQGDEDETVVPANFDRMIEAARAAYPDARERTVPVAGGARLLLSDAEGRTLLEAWRIGALGHAWSGGDPEGGYADADGPDASREMMRFFLSLRSRP